MTDPAPSKGRWRNRAVPGIGLASLFSNWSYEFAAKVVAAEWLRLARWPGCRSGF